MKRSILLIVSILTLTSRADEGMWMPQLIEALNIKDMKKNGFRLSAKQIYDANNASMKDAVAIFGGGCTAEVISNKGLILTNHHCGFSSIATLSSVEKDYLKNGYFAKNGVEELPCKGLTVTFIKRIEDVTARVMSLPGSDFTEEQKDSLIRVNIRSIEEAAKKDTHFEAFVRPFYYGNEYYLFVIEIFKDIRLVGAPPESLGKFGGETDNWIWPRHNADFSMFRIYADKDNKPTEFKTDNVPYKPLYSFPISLKGAEEGDFTMVFGFPGRTQEYLTSHAVKLLMDEQDPRRVMLREKRMEIMESAMNRNDTLRLMYVSRYAGVANGYKKWKGEMLGLRKSSAVEVKQKREKEFLALFEKDKAKKEKYNGMFTQFDRLYSDFSPLSRQYDYFAECLWGIDGFRMAGGYINVFAELKKKSEGKENKFDKLLKETTPQIPFKNFDKETDRKLCKAMLEIYTRDIDRDQMPAILDSMLNAHNGDTRALSDYLYDNSRFVDNTKAKAMYSDFEKNAAEYEKDPLYMLAREIFGHYQKKLLPQLGYIDRQINELQQEYMGALIANVKDRKFYPDANGTMRIAYGKVASYEPRDGVKYKHYTTLDGLVEKYYTGEEDYKVKKELITLYEKKDYGQYADKNGQLRTAFIGSNHTTGGNSGSPVLNAKGELIGTNFDRNWEGTMSDIMYNVKFCRNITVDIRFTLWVVDKYAGAGYLLEEMKLVR